MATPRKTERNEQLIRLRKKDPKKYSYRVLGGIFNISWIAAREIYLKYESEFIHISGKKEDLTR